MHEKQMQAFTDELEKIGGPMGFLRGGWAALKSLGSKAGRSGMWGAAKELPGNLSRAWQSGGIGQVGKVLAHAEPVQAAALGAGGLYAGHRMIQGGGNQ